MIDTTEIDQLLNKTRGQLFYKKGSGFLGALLCNMKFEWNDRISTAATNGEYLFWNPKFFMKLDPETRVTVLAHELWHVAYLHVVRGKSMVHNTYNIAADHVINLMLKEHGYYMDGFPYCMDSKYTGWSTEEVYDDLMANPPPPSSGGLGDDIEYTKSDIATSDTIAKVIEASVVARMTGKAGDIPEEITLVLEKFLDPKLPWRTILADFFNEITEMEYSIRRPNRRYQDPILPGLIGMTGLEHLMYGIDISGSVSDHDILVFNSEVKFIKEEFNPQLLTLLTFDIKIRDVYRFEPDDPFEQIVVTGRGGTSLHDLFERAKKEKPSCLVVFTDLDVSIPMNPGVPVIWIVTQNPGVKVPYGKIIHLTDKENHI